MRTLITKLAVSAGIVIAALIGTAGFAGADEPDHHNGIANGNVIVVPVDVDLDVHDNLVQILGLFGYPCVYAVDGTRVTEPAAARPDLATASH